MDHSLIDYIKRKKTELNLPIFEVGWSGEDEEGQLYFDDDHSPRPIYSLSKNFVSLTLGAISLSHPVDFNEDVYSLFASSYSSIPEIWKQVTIENVLTQTTGIDKGFLDCDQEDMKKYGNDYLLSTLLRPITYKPGAKFVYSDSNYYLASRIIEKIADEPYGDVLKTLVLNPLEIRLSISPLTDLTNRLMGATGLFLHALDVAKLGSVVSSGGIYKGKRLVSGSYLRQATSPIAKVDENTGYGYSFWNNTPNNKTYGNGMYGQFLIIGDEVSICYLADSRKGDLHHLDQILLGWKKGGS